MLGKCAAAGGNKVFGALLAGDSAATIGQCLKTKGLEGHAVHALAMAYVCAVRHVCFALGTLSVACCCSLVFVTFAAVAVRTPRFA